MSGQIYDPIPVPEKDEVWGVPMFPWEWMLILSSDENGVTYTRFGRQATHWCSWSWWPDYYQNIGEIVDNFDELVELYKREMADG